MKNKLIISTALILLNSIAIISPVLAGDRGDFPGQTCPGSKCPRNAQP